MIDAVAICVHMVFGIMMCREDSTATWTWVLGPPVSQSIHMLIGISLGAEFTITAFTWNARHFVTMSKRMLLGKQTWAASA